ncbi:MAG TPA: hypothetical protein VGD29_31735 [Actinoplanes sp.]|jgi:hypothetical protein
MLALPARIFQRYKTLIMFAWQVVLDDEGLETRVPLPARQPDD